MDRAASLLEHTWHIFQTLQEGGQGNSQGILHKFSKIKHLTSYRAVNKDDWRPDYGATFI